MRSGEYSPLESAFGPHGAHAGAQPLPHNPRKQRENPAAAGSGERFRGGKWRRRWDSNPRDPSGPTPLAGERLRPLGHVSAGVSIGRWQGKQGGKGASPNLRGHGVGGMPDYELASPLQENIARHRPFLLPGRGQVWPCEKQLLGSRAARSTALEAGGQIGRGQGPAHEAGLVERVCGSGWAAAQRSWRGR